MILDNRDTIRMHIAAQIAPIAEYLHRSDVFEVVALGQIDGEPLGLPTMRIQVVTARLDGQAAEGQAPGETVRFLFAVDDLRPVPAQPKPDKVL